MVVLLGGVVEECRAGQHGLLLGIVGTTRDCGGSHGLGSVRFSVEATKQPDQLRNWTTHQLRT